MISYGKQSIDEQDLLAVAASLKSDFLTCGPKVKEFEEKFAAYVGSKYAVAVSNGTAALHLACLAAGLKDGEELITSPMTFAASANCAFYCGAKPVFVDINEQGLIDENKIESAITSKTKIILPVHYTGLPCNLEKIKEIADKYNLIVIEDACHALGAKYNHLDKLGKPDKQTKIGDCAYSDMACFSFHPVKHITTGEGGMITTNSKEFYEKLLMLRNHGITKDYDGLVDKTGGSWYHEMQELGYNYRITDFQCALGISQLQKIDTFVNKRREIAQKYVDAFKDNQNLKLPNENDSQWNSYHLFVIQVPTAEIRKNLFLHLQKNGINCQVHYIPVYWHPFYQKKGYQRGICPNAERFYDRIISLPIYPALKDEEQEKVIKIITNYLTTNNKEVNQMSQKDIFYQFEGDNWHSRNKFCFDLLNPSLDAPLRLLKMYHLNPKHVLEIGCSEGFRLNLINKEYNSNCIGVEPSENAVVEGSRKYPNIKLTRGVCSNIPLQDKFDLIIVNFVLHWVDREDLVKCISEIDRLLLPGGFLLLGDFYPDKNTKNKYHHLPEENVWTYKQDYTKIFLELGNYDLISTLSTGHSPGSLFVDFMFVEDSDKRSHISLIHKKELTLVK